MTHFSTSKASRGFSLIELLLVLAIVAALAVAAFIVYPRVQAGRNAAFEAQTLASIQATVRALFTTGNYTNVSMDIPLRATFFPAHMVNGTTIQNQWGGTASIGASTSAGYYPGDGVRARYFRITYTQVPTDVCIRLAGAAAQNFGTIMINTDPADTGHGIQVQDLFSGARVQLNESRIAENCKGTGGRATMVFVSN